MSKWLLTGAILALSTMSVLGFSQAKNVTIQPGPGNETSNALLSNLREMKASGQLTDEKAAKQMMDHPSGKKFRLPAPHRTPLEPKEVYREAVSSHVRVGWYYLCTHCSNWHVNLAGGYAIAEGAVATCEHVVKKPDNFKEGCLIAVTSDDKVLKIRSITALNAAMDVAILETEGEKLQALPLNLDASPGDQAYLYSSPLHAVGYFSAGMVNRFFWSTGKGDLDSLDGMKSLRVNVSTDWAPGSSGAPVLDKFGNVIGHVSTIFTGNTEDNKGTMIVFHNAVPARLVKALAEGK